MSIILLMKYVVQEDHGIFYFSVLPTKAASNEIVIFRLKNVLKHLVTAWNKYIKEAFLNGLTFDLSGKYLLRFVLLAREQVNKAEC